MQTYRILALISGTLLGGGAGELPVPPLPPTATPPTFAAPVPDDTVQPPTPEAANSPVVRPDVFNAPIENLTSDGFLPGSRYEDSEERKGIQTPGVSVTIPLR
jgi:hypothetical protein